MMNTTAIILKCNTATKFHSGKIRVDTTNMLEDSSEILHSDTLFSALVNLAAKVMPNQIEDFIRLFEENKLKISSIFYCLEKEDKYIYFLPKPLNFNILQSGKDRKSVKKVKYISKGIWEQKIDVTQWFDATKCTVIQNKFVCLNEELVDLGIEAKHRQLLRFFDEIATPKVHVHKKRSDKDNRYYSQANVHIADNEGVVNVHLFFLLQENLEEQEKKQFNTLLALLPFEGIGGDRSAGSGIFEGINQKAFSIKNQNGKAISLSLSIPANDKEFSAYENYEFSLRGGRQTHADGILKRVRVVNEGAVLNADIHGNIVDISNDTSKVTYLRNGKCLTLIY